MEMEFPAQPEKVVFPENMPHCRLAAPYLGQPFLFTCLRQAALCILFLAEGIGRVATTSIFPVRVLGMDLENSNISGLAQGALNCSSRYFSSSVRTLICTRFLNGRELDNRSLPCGHQRRKGKCGFTAAMRAEKRVDGKSVRSKMDIHLAFRFLGKIMQGFAG